MFSFNLLYIWTFFILARVIDANEKSDELFKKIGKHKIVYPKILTRPKRSNADNGYQVEDESPYIMLNRWIIETNVNNDILVSPNYVVQWIYSASHNKPTFDRNLLTLDTCAPLQGTVRGVKNSSVLLTLCDNDIFGLITINRKSYFVQPVNSNGRHALYLTKKLSQLTKMMDAFNLYSRNLKKHPKKHSTMDNEIEDGNQLIFVDKLHLLT